MAELELNPIPSLRMGAACLGSRNEESPWVYRGLGEMVVVPSSTHPRLFTPETLSLVGIGLSGQSNPHLSAWEGSAGAPSTALLAPGQMDGTQSA